VVSGFRSKGLNDAISGSSQSSQHMRGEAFDLDLDGTFNGVNNAQLFEYIHSHLSFDQLIWEFGTNTSPAWIHVSYDVSGKNRKNVFYSEKTNGKVHYKPFYK
jgi:hypothetical protein